MDRIKFAECRPRGRSSKKQATQETLENMRRQQVQYRGNITNNKAVKLWPQYRGSIANNKAVNLWPRTVANIERSMGTLLMNLDNESPTKKAAGDVAAGAPVMEVQWRGPCQTYRQVCEVIVAE